MRHKKINNGLDNLLSLVSPGCFVLANKLDNPLPLVFAGCLILAGCFDVVNGSATPRYCWCLLAALYLLAALSLQCEWVCYPAIIGVC